MTDTYQPTAEPAPPPAAPPSQSYEPAPSAPEPSPPPSDTANYDSQDLGSQYEGQHFQDGKVKIHTGGEAGARSAAKELARRRGQRPSGLDDITGPDSSVVQEIGYLDNRPKDATVDAKTAAKDLTQARADIAAQIQNLRAQINGTEPPAQAQPGAGPEGQAQPQQQGAEPAADDYAAQIAQYTPQIQQNISQARQFLAEQEQIAAQHGIDVPQSPHAQAVAQAHAVAQAVSAERDRLEFALQSVVAEAIGININEFAGIKTEADLQRLATQDPMKFNRFNALQRGVQIANATVQQQQGQRQQQIAQQQAQYQQQFEQQAKYHDKLVEQTVPELHPSVPPQVRAQFQQAALETLQAKGLSTDEIRTLWNNGFLRDHRSQQLIADATRWRLAQAKAHAATTRPLPPVQRPGMAPDRAVYAEHQMQDLLKQVDGASGNKQLQLAARLVAERRRNAR